MKLPIISNIITYKVLQGPAELSQYIGVVRKGKYLKPVKYAHPKLPKFLLGSKTPLFRVSAIIWYPSSAYARLRSEFRQGVGNQRHQRFHEGQRPVRSVNS